MRASKTHGAVRLREKTLASGARSLYLDIYRDGVRRYEFLKLYLIGDRRADEATRRLAETIRSKRELDIASNTHDLPSESARSTRAVDYFKRICDSKEDAAWRTSLRRFTDFCDERHPRLVVSEITRAIVNEYRQWLLARFANQNTARQHLVLFRHVLRRAVVDGLLVRNPAAGVEPIKRIETETVVLSIEEIRALSKTKCEHPGIKRAFLFACFTGLRVSDLRALTWGMIRGERLEHRQRKTRKVEWVPLSEMAKKFLGAKPKDATADTPVFDGLDDWAIYGILNRWKDSAKLDKPRIGFHTARHTFATMALSNGVDLYTVSKLLGHSTVKMTERYAKVVDRVKEESVLKLPTF